MTSGKAFPLAMASEDETVRIVFIRGGTKREKRLLSMGVKIDAEITVVNSQRSGGKVISCEGSRYALGGGMTQHILVVST